MSTHRDILQKALCLYMADTFNYIHTIKNFVDDSPEWLKIRRKESQMIADIQNRSKKNENQKSKNDNAFVEFLQINAIPGNAESSLAEYQQELQMELKASLEKTMLGLEELSVFLEAVEKLSVTSLHVFTPSQVLQLSDGADLGLVYSIILIAAAVCPVLLSFKRDNKVFFSPKLENTEVLHQLLNRYIEVIKTVCGAFRECSVEDFCLDKPMIVLKEDIPNDDTDRMIQRLKLLEKIRLDEDFRMVFLFKGEHKTFTKEFKEREDQMLKYLEELEPCAVQLDEMNKGKKISNVVGSSVGVVGGVLSIVGLALIPVTAGASLSLTLAGAGLGATSGVNSVVTTLTDIGINSAQKKKASETFTTFLKDVNVLYDCVNYAIYQHFHDIQNNSVINLKIGQKTFSLLKGIDSVIDCLSALKVLYSKETVVEALKAVVTASGRNASRVAADVPDVAQAAVKGPLAMSKAARVGFMALNGLFIGVDVFIIANDGISLSRGSETELSKWIRARAALWRSEINSFQKIHNSLEKGDKDSEENLALLKKPFY